ncbi:MAG TPA: ATP-dependent sacrificial sulfur transferase LarE [Thermoplasmata archaeon]|nr:ATP-dependent sacrificial sulfur transferase LarE [Thermoplasmata archaeon]
MATSLSAPLSPRCPEELEAHLAEGGRAVVALSGGVDSSLVASLAFAALGPEAVAVTLTGAAVSRTEVARAQRVASAIGIEHVLLEVDPLAREEYRENRPDRCYHCRSVETSVLRAFGARRAARQYLDGVQRDDLEDDRPGLRAMDEAGFQHPLLWAGWGKREVRSEAHRRGLPNWDQPSDACLASRVAHGEPVSAELLARVESAEQILLDLGFRRVRVRVRGGVARIEVDPTEVPRLLEEPLSSQVVRAVAQVGFTSVAVDPRGYRGALVELPTVP